MKASKLKAVCTAIMVLVVVVLLVPENAVIPVQNATSRDWNPKSFWFEPWGVSGVHKGIDIFAPDGRSVQSAVPGVLLYQGRFGIGGNVVAVLGPKWRIHYYAHLNETKVNIPLFIGQGEILGEVGTSGNARGKPPHLHYSVISIIPLPWRASFSTQGWKKIFFLNPDDILSS